MSLFDRFKTSPNDVQVWDCEPLVIADSLGNVQFSGNIQIEFTPTSEMGGQLGFAQFSEDSLASGHSCAVDLCVYYDNPVRFGFRQGVTMMGRDASGAEVNWYINGSADKFLTEEPVKDEIPYDEETAKLLEEEIGESKGAYLNLKM